MYRAKDKPVTLVESTGIDNYRSYTMNLKTLKCKHLTLSIKIALDFDGTLPINRRRNGSYTYRYRYRYRYCTGRVGRTDIEYKYDFVIN